LSITRNQVTIWTTRKKRITEGGTLGGTGKPPKITWGIKSNGRKGGQWKCTLWVGASSLKGEKLMISIKKNPESRRDLEKAIRGGEGIIKGLRGVRSSGYS